MTKIPKILFLAQSGDDLPSVRFRVLPYVELGKALGWDVRKKRIPKSFFKRLSFFAGLGRHDAIVIQKKLFSPLEPMLLKSKCSNLVYDFDDALWTFHPSVPPSARRDARSAKDTKRFLRQCQQVDTVIAGNSYLAERGAESSSNIEIIPTPLDTDKYIPGSFHQDRSRVGWMGTSSNMFFIDEVLQILKPVLDADPASVVSNKVYAGNASNLVTYEDWSSEREVEQLQSMDIGLMPLTDDEYTRGKCGFKLLQYMACGAVPVASAVGFNKEIIEDGKDGFLISSPQQWLERVQLLKSDPELRAKMREAARKKVVSKFSLRTAAEKLWAALGVS